MYNYQRKLQQEAVKFQPKTKIVTKSVVSTSKNANVNEDREVTIDEMLQTLSDLTPQTVIPVSEFFGWFKKTATPNEQLLLTSFSSIVLPRLAARINQNASSPEKVLSILKTECTKQEKDLIARLAAEIIPNLSKKYALSRIESAQISGSSYYYQKKLHKEVKQALVEKILGFGSKKAPPKIPDFYNRPPQGWKSVTIDDPTGPGIPAISKIIPGIGTILVVYSEGGIKKTFGGFRQTWSVYGDLSFIPDQLCKKAVDPENPEQVAKAFINLRDWNEIVKGFSQAHTLVMRGKI